MCPERCVTYVSVSTKGAGGCERRLRTVGDSPVNRRTALPMCAWSAKPAAKAISASGVSMGDGAGGAMCPGRASEPCRRKAELLAKAATDTSGMHLMSLRPFGDAQLRINAQVGR
jgi:hypothetical protein